MHDTLESFLREGVHRYPEAKSAVDGFQTEMQRRLVAILEARTWRQLKPRTANEWAPENRFTHTVNDGCWAGALIHGRTRLGDDTQVAIGIWWEPRHLRKPVVFFAHLNVDAKPFVFTRESDHDHVKRTEAEPPYVRYYLEPGKDVDFDRDFGLLLDQLEAVMAA
ncbi:MAG: hypothetical protein HY906_15460 [Deltaproteobacteria bacterium]|nr:hypothetical protein [Deltaproteobacteria bacterium]